MQHIDKRLNLEERSILLNMIGKTFVEYVCDEFHFRPAVYQAIGFKVDDQSFVIENQEFTIDYFGEIEDVSILSVKSSREEKFTSRVVNGSLTYHPIAQSIEDILIYDDAHFKVDKGKDLFEYSFTKAIAFIFKNRQLVFIKDIWLSEDIFIYFGPDAISKIPPADSDLEEFEGYESRATRNVTSITNKILD